MDIMGRSWVYFMKQPNGHIRMPLAMLYGYLALDARLTKCQQYLLNNDRNGVQTKSPAVCNAIIYMSASFLRGV